MKKRFLNEIISMKYVYKKFLSITIVICFTHILYANQIIETFQDYQNRAIELRQITDPQLFAQAAGLFTAAILKAYENISDETLKIAPNTRKEVMDSYFQQEELLPFSEKKFFAIGAFFENHLIGYVSFDTPTKTGELYIRELMVDPNYWQNGIGKKLLFSSLNLFPTTTCLVLVTRRQNEYARTFYRKLAFDECEEYVHEPWDPKDFIGYKKVIQ